MKLLKNKINSKNILKLNLIKYKTYETVHKKNNLPDNYLENITINLKQSLNIIFKYHKNNKRILFIGISNKKLENIIKKNTIHRTLPNFSNSIDQQLINNFISNSIRLNKYLFKTNKSVFFNILQKKPELIVIFNHKKKQHILKETDILKIPVIEFDYNKINNNFNYSYYITNNLNINKHKKSNNIFFLILNSMFNKSFNKN